VPVLKNNQRIVSHFPNLGGSIEPVHNPVDIVEHALSKGASSVLMPVSCRRALVDLSDEVATKVQVLFYSDAADAMRRVLHEG
jgi:ATP-dependent Lon protease